jgi:hypothetical protein
MLKTGLEFAPGTTDECKKMIGGLFKPGDILSAYRMARIEFKTGDLVVSVSESDPDGFEAEPRTAYLKRLRQTRGSVPLLMQGLAEKSAQSVVRLPFESDAMWFIVVRGSQAVPIMCVLFAAPYVEGAQIVN